jgi:transcription antitermination factor NusG
MDCTRLKSRYDSDFLPLANYEFHWYAAYTNANHEKRVAEQLAIRSVEHFLPLYTSIRRWKDRRVTLRLPLFPGYIFVYIALRDRLFLQQIPGVVQLVGFDGTPTPMSKEEIETIRSGFAMQSKIEPHPYLKIGRRVRINKGPLAGIEGFLQQRRGSYRFILSVNLIRCSLAIDVDANEVEPLQQSRCFDSPGSSSFCGTVNPVQNNPLFSTTKKSNPQMIDSFVEPQSVI